MKEVIHTFNKLSLDNVHNGEKKNSNKFFFFWSYKIFHVEGCCKISYKKHFFLCKSVFCRVAVSVQCYNEKQQKAVEIENAGRR